VGITSGQFYRGEVPAPFPYDPEQAKRLLDEAGWVETKKDGIREKNGHKFRFSLLINADVMPGAVYIQDQFRRVGIDMKTVTVPLIISLDRVREGKFDANFLRVSPFAYDWNHGGYDNPEFERLQKNMFLTFTHEESDSAARKLWPIFQSDIPWTFLYPRVTFNVVHRRIRGLKSPHRPDPARFIEHLWIEEEK
jgi:peptide/nickel transport system substrate-binding protein